MLMNMNEAFEKQRGCTVGFNFYNIETLTAILSGAKKANKIVMAAFGEGYLSHTPLCVAAALAKEYSRLYDLPFVLHLDHAKNMDTIKEAMQLGFTSVMYDGSSLPLEENIKNTREIVTMGKGFGITVEGELGALNNEDGTGEIGGAECYTDVLEAQRFVEETNVSALAIAVGNAHGVYRGAPHIDIERVRAIKKVTGIPLVLHGSSGIPAVSIKKAVESGIRKINVNTDLAMAGAHGAKQYLQQAGDGARLEQMLAAAVDAMTDVVVSFLK